MPKPFNNKCMYVVDFTVVDKASRQ